MFSRRPFIQEVFGSIFTQSLLSVTSFIIGILVARGTSKSEYGIYVICFAVTQVFLSLQNALVNTPLMVLLPSKESKGGEWLVSGLAFGQWVILVPLLVVCGSGLMFYKSFGSDHSILVALGAVLFAIPTSYMREFLRVLYYCHIRIDYILVMDAAFVISALSGMFLLGKAGSMSASNVILILGSAYLLSAVLGYKISYQGFQFNVSWIKRSFRETWQYSRWSLMGIAVTNAQSYGLVFVVSLILGLQATADLSAARLLLMPFGVCISSTQRIFVAKGSQVLAHNGRESLRKLLLAFFAFFSVTWICYGLVLLFFHKVVIASVLTSKYDNIDGYLILMGLFFLVNSYSFLAGLCLQVFREFKNLAMYGLISAISMLALCVYLTSVMGSEGALVAAILGEMVLLVLLGARLVRLLGFKKRFVC